MSSSTRLGLGLLAVGAALGVLGDLLLRALPLGINVALWTLCFVAATVGLAARHGRALGGARWQLAAALAFALLIAWRASPLLAALNFLSILAVLALMPLGVALRQMATTKLSSYVLNFTGAGVHLAGGPLFAAASVRWQEVGPHARLRTALPAVRGTLMAVPLVLVFGGLFASADAAFQDLVYPLFNWDIDEAVAHILTIFVVGWAVTGGLAYLLLREHDPDLLDNLGIPTSPGLTLVDIAVPLAALDALFLAFVAVQGRYLFGGDLTVRLSESLTYAEYARRGFFELVIVAALALGVLLAAEWAAPKEQRRDVLLFRLLAGMLVALVFVVMASAVQRMLLYQSEYGLTELRVYTTAFMAWLAVVFLLFVGTALRGNPRPFAFAALASGLLGVATLSALNPDALIVQTNAARPRFDANYNVRLSADAVPALVAALPQLPEAERSHVAGCVLLRWGTAEEPAWRTWNAARSAARQLVQANREQLEGMAGLPVSYFESQCRGRDPLSP